MSRAFSVIAVREGRHSEAITVGGGDRLTTVVEINVDDFRDLLAIAAHEDEDEPEFSEAFVDESQALLVGAEAATPRRRKSRTSLLQATPPSVPMVVQYADGMEFEVLDGRRVAQVFRRMQYLTCIAAIGGFLSGYNTGVISGALLPLTRVFDLTVEHEEALVSATIVCAFGASLFGGGLNRACGRRCTILGAALVFVSGGLTVASASNFDTLILGQVILGMGIGLESLTSPLYISELAQPKVRGMLVSAYALMMCFGQFFAGMVDGVFGYFTNGWRFMFGTAALPGTVLFLGFWGLPESPAWLLAKGRTDEARHVLETYRDSDAEAQEEVEAIQDCLRHSQQEEGGGPDGGGGVTVGQMWSSPLLRQALVVGCSLMVLQQFCGVNVVMYYSATIYRMSGFAEVTAIWLAAVTALAQLIGLGLSLCLVETAGRRPLVLASFAGVGVCCLGLGVGFYLARVLSEPVLTELSSAECLQRPAWVWNGRTTYCYDCTLMEACGFCGGACVAGTEQGPLEPESCPAVADSLSTMSWQFDECTTTPAWVNAFPIGFMVLYLIVFGVGAAGLPWTINSEIYPVKYRSLAVAISTGCNWLCNLIISSTFLTLSDPSVLTLYGSFFLYGLLSLAGVLWLYWKLPETKGLSYHEIETCFATKKTGNGDKKDPPLFQQEQSTGVGSTDDEEGTSDPTTTITTSKQRKNPSYGATT